MKRILILLCLPLMTLGQNVNIPDTNFKAYLVGEPSINTNGDTEIQLSEAAAFNGGIYCDNRNISDLTGIEDFTALTELYCGANQLTMLDVSQNTALSDLDCYGNQLSTLDVSANTTLTYLPCYDNQLTTLNVRNGNNINMTTLDSRNNPNLTCINVDDAAWATANWTYIDPQHYFSNNCPPPSAIEEYSTNKQILRSIDVLGRKAQGKKNEPLFYIYDDGTVEKRLTIE